MGRLCVHDRGADADNPDRAGPPCGGASRSPEVGGSHRRRRVRRRAGPLAVHQQALGAEHDAVLDPGRLLRRRGRRARPDGGRQGSRGRRAPVRPHVSARRHDVRGRRELHVRALRGRARRERVRAPVARADARRREPAQRPRIRRLRIRSRQPDRRCRPERRLWLRRTGDGRRSLLRPPTVADGPAHPDQLERAALGRKRRKPGPAVPGRLQPGRVYRPPGLSRPGSPARRIPRSRRLANPRPLVGSSGASSLAGSERNRACRRYPCLDMPAVHYTNLLIVVTIGLLAPLALGFFPRFRLPAIVLELVLGIVIGPSGLGWANPDLPVSTLALIGLAFLLFLSGLEIDVERLQGPVLKLTTIGFALSFAIAITLGLGLKAGGFVKSPLFVAIVLAASSVSVIFPVLKDADVTSSRFGQIVLASASVAEFGAIILLSLFFSGKGSSSITGTLILVGV